MPIHKKLLERLKNNDPSLIELDLSCQNPKLTIEDIRLLVASNSYLKELYVFGNQIDTKCAKALAQNQTLATLDISNNYIGAEGAKDLVLNQTLTNVYIRENNIDMQLILSIEQRIAMNRQAVIQKRNHFLIITLLLLRHNFSVTGYLPLEICQHICHILNFPSMQVSNRSGKEMFEFLFQHLPEFNAQLRNKVSTQMVENIKPQANQSRFSFFVPRTVTSVVLGIIQEPQENYSIAVKK